MVRENRPGTFVSDAWAEEGVVDSTNWWTSFSIVALQKQILREFGVQYVYQGFNSFERKEGRNRIQQEKSNCDTALTNLMGSSGTRIASQFCRLAEVAGTLSPCLALSLGIDHLAMWGQCVWSQQGSSLSLRLRRGWLLETVCWS